MQKNETRKCIAVILAKPEQRYQSGIIRGINKAAFENGMNVAVFAVTYPRSVEEYHNGEMNIYRLINVDMLAGIIYLPDTITYGNRREIIDEGVLRRAAERNVPVVTIDYEFSGIPCFYCDDSDVVGAMVNHFIDCHDCRDIAYMTGTKGHPHAEHRLAAFRSAMERHGLPVDEDRLYYGDFWYGEGENFVNKLLASERGLPDAIVCANADMAESVYTALFNRDLHIPRDVKLAGFDEYSDNRSFISCTMRRPESTGYAACYGIMELMEGKSLEQRTYVSCDFESNFALTCGCVSVDDYNLLILKPVKLNTADEYFSESNTMSEALISSKEYNDMLWTASWFTFFMNGFDSFYICMCDGWDSAEDSPDDEGFTKGYTPEMQINLARTRKADGDGYDTYVGGDRRFPSEEMFPLLHSAQGKPSAYIFRSLHCQDRCFGYAVIGYEDANRLPEEIYDFWLNALSNAIESQRRLKNMKDLYRKMRENAVTDLMTGLLNRNGFNMMMPKLIADAHRDGSQILVVMADLNGLKYVNDTFGHNEGDELIKTAAGALARTWIGGAVNEKNFRIGGDEFVKAAYGKFDNERLEEFRRALYDYLDAYNRTSGKPYPVYMPLGFCLCEAADGFDADRLLSEADKHMYEDKIRLKKETGFDPKRK